MSSQTRFTALCTEPKRPFSVRPRSSCSPGSDSCQNQAMFLTIPTIMTWTRIVAIPLIVGVFYIDLPEPSRNLIATVLFVLFAATD